MIDRRARAAGWVLLVAVVLAACGGDDPATTDDPPSSTSTTTSTSTTDSAPSTTGDGTGTLPPVDGPIAEGRTALPGFGEIEIRIVEGPDGEPVVLCVLVADTPEQRQRGLMGVTDLGGYDGMLFRFAEDAQGGFWMKDTLLPLSIAYLDAEGAVVSTADMDPCPAGTARCPSYPADGPYRQALEVEQGGLAPLGLVAGTRARVEVTGPCAPLTPD